MPLPYELSEFLQQYIGTDEQGQPFSRYDPILFGPNYDINTGLTENQKRFGYDLAASGVENDKGSDFLNLFNQNFPQYGFNPYTAQTAAQTYFGSRAEDENGPQAFAAFQQDLLSGQGEGYERALGLLNEAGFSQDEINAFVLNLGGTAGRTDQFNFLGDNLLPVVALLGLAAGGAGLYGAYGAGAAGGEAAGSAGLGASSSGGGGLESFLGASTSGLGEGTAGSLAPTFGAGGAEVIASPIPASALGPSTTPSLLAQAKLAASGPIAGIAGAPSYAQGLQGLSVANSLATLAQNPSAQGGLGLAGSLSGIPGAGFLGSAAGAGIDTLAQPSGGNVAESNTLNSIASLLPLLGLTGYTLGAQGGFAPNQRTESQVTYDPLTQALNQFRLNQVQGAQDATGGLASLLSGNNPAYQLNPQTADLAQILSGQSYTPGLNPQDWYKTTEQGLGASFLQNRGLNQADYNNQINSLRGVNQGNLAANQAFQANTTNLIPFGQNYLNEIVAPTLQNQFALSGLGRSGAIQEALAKAGAQISLPLAQQQSAQEHAINQQRFGQDYQLRSQQAGAEAQLGSLLNTLQGGQGNQYAQNLFGLNQQYPNIDIALRQAPLERLSAGIGASDIQRQLDQQKFQTILQSFLGVNQGTPYSPGVNQTQTGSGSVLTNNIAPFLGQQALLGSLGQNNIFSNLVKGIGGLFSGDSNAVGSQPNPSLELGGFLPNLSNSPSNTALRPLDINTSFNNPFGSNPFSSLVDSNSFSFGGANQ